MQRTVSVFPCGETGAGRASSTGFWVPGKSVTQETRGRVKALLEGCRALFRHSREPGAAPDPEPPAYLGGGDRPKENHGVYRRESGNEGG